LRQLVNLDLLFQAGYLVDDRAKAIPAEKLVFLFLKLFA
jgi:hypothetical protein